MLHLIDKYATDIVACGEGTMDAIWRDGWRSDPRCRVIYNSVDVAQFEEPVDRNRVRAELGVPLDAPLFVHMGREAPEKNHRRLLEIFAEIGKAAPDARLVLAGEGTDDPNGITSRGVRELGIANRVLALGIRHDVPRLLNAADTLLLPSLWEGLPGVVLEACAAGVPVLATDLPGVREIASRLALVRYLPLDADSPEWAAAALALPAEAARLKLRDTAIDRFRRSVFDVNRAAAGHREVWARATEPRVALCS
jgi:glycosyltransferase involved in cell wall biosynthesis